MFTTRGHAASIPSQFLTGNVGYVTIWLNSDLMEKSMILKFHRETAAGRGRFETAWHSHGYRCRYVPAQDIPDRQYSLLCLASQSSAAINADAMTTQQLRDALNVGYKDIKAGRIEDAAAAFAKRREARQ